VSSRLQVALIENSTHEIHARAAVYSEVLYLEREGYNELCDDVDSEKFRELVETEAIKVEQMIMRAKKNISRFAKLTRMGSNKGGGNRDSMGRGNNPIHTVQVLTSALAGWGGGKKASKKRLGPGSSGNLDG
jgi:hypothetical protein